ARPCESASSTFCVLFFCRSVCEAACCYALPFAFIPPSPPPSPPRLPRLTPFPPLLFHFTRGSALMSSRCLSLCHGGDWSLSPSPSPLYPLFSPLRMLRRSRCCEGLRSNIRPFALSDSMHLSSS